MFWFKLALLLLSYPCRVHTTSCTEDSQCSIRYYCEENIHSCRECLRCEDFKREPPSSDACIKSLLECGDCFKGLMLAYEGVMSGPQCIPATTESPTAVLPLYGWVAIAVSLVLIVAILCLIAKMKNFKFAYATSARPAARQPAAPPSPADPPEAFEMQQLVESPYLCKSIQWPGSRPRENANSQNARVFNNPAYVRPPQHASRPDSPNLSVAIRDGSNDITEVASLPTTDPAWAVGNTTGNGNLANSLGIGRRVDKIEASPLQGFKTNFGHQDSNNNWSGEDSGRGGSAAGACFVINVVENINSGILSHAEFNT